MVDSDGMKELLVIAVLLWFWVIEKRLSNLRTEMKSMHRDMDLLRNERFQAKSTLAQVKTDAADNTLAPNRVMPPPRVDDGQIDTDRA